jgi:hypothetical protein
MNPITPKKERVDGQITSLAGEFFVAAELLKRELQVSLTFGNAKAVDLFANNPRLSKTFTVQVKALRNKNCFLISPKNVNVDHVYVFVILNKPEEPVQYFIVPGRTLKDEPLRFGKDFQHPTMPGIQPRALTEFAGAWNFFEE